MSQQLYTLSKPSIKYLCGLINQIVNLPTDIINNVNLADNLTFSNIHIKNLVDQCLTNANTEAQKLVGALTHLTCEKTATQPTLDNSKINVIYLYSNNDLPPFQQFLKISDTELIDMGSTSISLTDYLTATEIASTYAKQVDLNTLTTEINTIKDTIGTETLTTTSQVLKGAINEVKTELNNKIDKTKIVTTVDSASTNEQIPSAKAIYDKCVKDNNLKTYTKLEQLGLTEGTETLKNIAKAMINGSMMIFPVTASCNTSEYPVTYGGMTVYKTDANRVEFIFYPATNFADKGTMFLCTYHGAKDIISGWKKICTTSVIDIDRTNITLTAPTGMTITPYANYYEVKNGICYVQINNSINTTTNIAFKVVANGLPKPKTIRMGTVSNPDGGIPLLYQVNTSGQLTFYVNGAIGGSRVFQQDFSYPITE